jgi:hypothetical protein
MARPSVLLSADARDECITIRNSQITRARMKKIQNLLRHTNQKNDSETAFNTFLFSSIQTRKKKISVKTMYFTIYSMLFLEDRPKIHALCANSQSTMAVDIRNMQLTGPIFKTKWSRLDAIYLFCHAKRRLRPAMFDAGSDVSEPSRFNYRKFG